MKCPVLTGAYIIGVHAFLPPGEMVNADCLQAECAWWDNPYERCGVLTLAQMSKLILDAMEKK